MINLHFDKSILTLENEDVKGDQSDKPYESKKHI